MAWRRPPIGGLGHAIYEAAFVKPPVQGICGRSPRTFPLAVVYSAAVGDDYGNVTSFNEGQLHGSTHGMNRLNHCPAIFEEAYRSG
ncbi:MAG: hypothetical protein V2A79_02705, partial [Planctomycetota bacterium]